MLHGGGGYSAIARPPLSEGSLLPGTFAVGQERLIS